MSTEANTSSGFDSIKWLICILLLGGAVYGNHYFAQQESVSILIRVAVVLSAVLVALLVAASTDKGQTAVAFAKESRMEVRKVVWPTRQEAIQTTLVVLVFVVLISLVLWGIDALLAWGVNGIMNL